MIIRSENPADYPAIANLNVRAFEERAAEATIVALHRQRAAFDHELSIVAEKEGRIVGHALFSPQVIRLLDQDVPAVLLGPIAVDPGHQRQGIGGALIEEGHRIARGKGFMLSFLIGHPEYYPRHGYVQRVYGGSAAEVPVATYTGKSTLTTRPPTESDIPTLRDLWRREEGRIDFVIDPGDALIDWISPNPAIEARVYLRDGQIIGYTRINNASPWSPLIFLAADPDSARRMVAHIVEKAPEGSKIRLPLHPYSGSATAFPPSPVRGWNAAMACPLVPGPLDEFLAQLRASWRWPGRVIWPVAFDLA